VAAEEDEFVRFSLLFRLQHMVLMASCIVLIITGLPLKFPDARISGMFFGLVGGVQSSGAVHRVGAAVLILIGIFHMGYITLSTEGRREFSHLIPRLKDVRDVYQNLLYFFGLSRRGARFGRFSYFEKFDYWAVYWGMVVMIASGLILWWHNAAMALMPKFVADIALEAHSDEGLLAALAIIIWHMYNVHLNPEHFPMNSTWLTGRISRSKMLRHHPLEYQEIIPSGNGQTSETQGTEQALAEDGDPQGC
jgi:formate dehydrogenase subunit gamma